MNDNYYLIIRTAQSEIKAIESTNPESLKQLFPIIELTRGRKKTVGGKAFFPFDSYLHRLQESLMGLDVAIDVTSDEKLSCNEIERLYDYTNGYDNWIKLLKKIKVENCFNSISPTIIMNFDDPDFEMNISLQIETLCMMFDTILYRSSITDEYCYDDLPMILRLLPNDKKLRILIDCEYTPQAMEANMLAKLKARLLNFSKIIDDRCSLAFCATSFPNNISEIGNDNRDFFRLSEVSMHKKLLSDFPNLRYGDYGSINPVRNDTVVMARGWIPRIDVPLEDTVYYYRQRRVGSAYSDTYRAVAKSVMNDKHFPFSLDCWGIQQIKLCEHLVPSSSPSFWIAVRMNIHIEQQLIRLRALNDMKG